MAHNNFSIPLVLLLLGQEERVTAFFAALERAPSWYTYCSEQLYTSFGIRGATKFGKKIMHKRNYRKRVR